jgi:Xaa-Pro aminopeptidase
MNPCFEKLSLLQAALKDNSIDYYIIPSADPHLGEYIPDHWRIIPWLTGFTGSAATVVVTDSFAGLWTDSRYFIQAENQLKDSGFDQMSSGLPGNKDFITWLSENLDKESTIGIDGRTCSLWLLRSIEKLSLSKASIININCDLISELWSDRPLVSDLSAFDHPIRFCGKERSIKIGEVREEMKKNDVGYHLITSPDDIMWLLNIRGHDVSYSPLLSSFAIVGEEQVLFFADESKIPFKLAFEFDSLNIVMLPYEEIACILETLDPDETILITPDTTSASLFNSIPKGMTTIEDISIPTRLKAVKNKVEIENIGKLMVKDGVALTKLFYWLEHNVSSLVVSELSLSQKLYDFRSEQEDFHSPSFSSIVAYKEHGALPHYSASPETDSVITQDGILLIDSGGQYLDGTTDITRTIAMGLPTKQIKLDFTLVLKGTINLALAKFPAGTRGYQLDILARKALWEQGLNFGHGTGHGVGFFLNVHEGPQGISTKAGKNSQTAIEPGMLISDEPAIYREGEYGIRTENLILCYEDEITEFGQFLRFDTVSLCYIDKSLIDISLLDQKEIDWLNTYHSEVFDKLSPYLTEAEKFWLKEKTEPI